MAVKRVSLQVALVLCAIVVEVFSQFEGDSCVLDKSGGESGTCKVITDCQAAIDGVKRGVLPQTCGFTDTTPIVCCAGVVDMPIVVRNPESDYGKKSRQKCKEYGEYAKTTYLSPALAGPPKNISYLECSFEYVPQVVGGTKAKGKQFPHSAAIGYDPPGGGPRLYYCGGSLISENFVITAGHCQHSREWGSAKTVRLGDLNLVQTTDDAQPQEYDIAEFVRHPSYRPPSNYDDILLLRLAQNVIFNHYVRPLCLYTEDEPSTKVAIASGWGLTEHAGKTSDDLLEVTLEFYSQDDCYKAYEPNKRRLKNGIVKDSQLCAGSRTEMKDTCQGDSGGPLQIFNKDVQCMYQLVGITSFGKVCGVSRSPAVYTRVSHYIDWIEKAVWQ